LMRYSDCNFFYCLSVYYRESHLGSIYFETWKIVTTDLRSCHIHILRLQVLSPSAKHENGPGFPQFWRCVLQMLSIKRSRIIRLNDQLHYTSYIGTAILKSLRNDTLNFM
jgi:hypothetical protein